MSDHRHEGEGPMPRDHDTREQRPVNDHRTTFFSGRKRRYKQHVDRETRLDTPYRNSATLGYLFVVEPDDLFGQYFLIQGDGLIGSGESNHVHLPDEAVANPHARVKLEQVPGSRLYVFMLHDFGGRSGTFLNGEQVVGRDRIVENDVIRIAQYKFVFKTLTG